MADAGRCPDCESTNRSIFLPPCRREYPRHHWHNAPQPAQHDVKDCRQAWDRMLAHRGHVANCRCHAGPNVRAHQEVLALNGEAAHLHPYRDPRCGEKPAPSGEPGRVEKAGESTAGDSDNPFGGPEHSRTDGDVSPAQVAALEQQRPRWDKSTGHRQRDQEAERPIGSRQPSEPASGKEFEADHDWRRQMEAYGYDSVAAVGKMLDAARREGAETWKARCLKVLNLYAGAKPLDDTDNMLQEIARECCGFLASNLPNFTGAHWVNIVVRRNGKDEVYQADYLREFERRSREGD